MSTYIFAWNRFSEGARSLAEAMGVRRLKHENSRARFRRGDTIINWGSSQMPREFLSSPGIRVLNPPPLVHQMSNKHSFFVQMSENEDVPIPEFTNDKQVALGWLRDGNAVVVRKLLNSHSAKGLEIVDPTPDATLPNAPLYTKYFKKKEEFRVHVINGHVVTVQKKAKRRGIEIENTRVRNLDNGYVYIRDGFTCPEVVSDAALNAYYASNLDFGAFDIIYNHHHNRAVVLEVNTAPGIEGTTVQEYVDKFREIV